MTEKEKQAIWEKIKARLECDDLTDDAPYIIPPPENNPDFSRSGLPQLSNYEEAPL